jgi:hypothetical protein
VLRRQDGTTSHNDVPLFEPYTHPPPFAKKEGPHPARHNTKDPLQWRAVVWCKKAKQWIVLNSTPPYSTTTADIHKSKEFAQRKQVRTSTCSFIFTSGFSWCACVQVEERFSRTQCNILRRCPHTWLQVTKVCHTISCRQEGSSYRIILLAPLTKSAACHRWEARLPTHGHHYEEARGGRRASWLVFLRAYQTERLIEDALDTLQISLAE